MLAGFFFYLQLFEASSTGTLRFLDRRLCFLYISKSFNDNLLCCFFERDILVRVRSNAGNNFVPFVQELKCVIKMFPCKFVAYKYFT